MYFWLKAVEGSRSALFNKDGDLRMSSVMIDLI